MTYARRPGWKAARNRQAREQRKPARFAGALARRRKARHLQRTRRHERRGTGGGFVKLDEL